MKIGIMGLGITGNAVADYILSSRKNSDEIFISESRPLDGSVKKYYSALVRKYGKVPAEFGGHTNRLVEFSDIIVKSPGISIDSNPIFRDAKQKGISIVGELDFVFRRLHQRPSCVIAVTGTNGKTTATSLIGHILKKCKSFVGRNNVIVCGNIGLPLASVADKISSKTTVVIEVSSYQLEDAEYFYPDIGVILNITPDHLEHHKTMDAYIKAKSRIFTLQKQNAKFPSKCKKHLYCVLNYDDKICRALSKKIEPPTEAVFFTTKKSEKKLKVVHYEAPDKYIFDLSNSSVSVHIKPVIPGMHNIENILASLSAVRLTDNKIKLEEMKKAVESFRGVPHRLEFVRRIKGVDYINDSKSTNVDSAKVALESYPSGNIWLIMGGRDKGAPYAPLKMLVSNRVKGLLLIGEASRKIYSELKDSANLIFKCGDLETAVKKAHSLAVPGDVVLLSPACASFDQFENFEHRGEVFKKIVMSLPAS